MVLKLKDPIDWPKGTLPKCAKGTQKAGSGNGKQHSLPADPVHSFNFEHRDKNGSDKFARCKYEDLKHFKKEQTGRLDHEEKEQARTKNPSRPRLAQHDIEDHWSLKKLKKPTRLWGNVVRHQFGGEEREEGPDFWLSGEFWNTDSNIVKWGEHEIRRNLASSGHDVMRHDQVKRLVLQQPAGRTDNLGNEMPDRQCVSGVVSPDANFLEAYGFDLGQRDRQGIPVARQKGIAPGWNPTAKGEMFRSNSSYFRNVSRRAEHMKELTKLPLDTKQKQSVASFGRELMETASTLRPEDIAGEDEKFNQEGTQVKRSESSPLFTDSNGGHIMGHGRTHGSRSCRYWDSYDHTARREATKMSCGTHSYSFHSHPEGYPLLSGMELNPASVYTLKHKKGGEDVMRYHEEKNFRPHDSRPKPWMVGSRRPNTAPV
jgi:hypothetical protein